MLIIDKKSTKIALCKLLIQSRFEPTAVTQKEDENWWLVDKELWNMWYIVIIFRSTPSYPCGAATFLFYNSLYIRLRDCYVTILSAKWMKPPNWDGETPHCLWICPLLGTDLVSWCDCVRREQSQWKNKCGKFGQKHLHSECKIVCEQINLHLTDV